MQIAGIPSTAIEAIVVRVREETECQVDWHYVGGRGIVKVLGGAEAEKEVVEALEQYQLLMSRL